MMEMGDYCCLRGRGTVKIYLADGMDIGDGDLHPVSVECSLEEKCRLYGTSDCSVTTFTHTYYDAP